MEKVAFIYNGTFLSWNAIMIALAALVAITGFAALFLARGGKVISLLLAILLALVFSLYLSRMIHWYCRMDAYESFGKAMTDFMSGGFALLGVFAGCGLTVGLLRLVRIERNPCRMLDCMALSGCAAIAVGRLAALFDVSDRGPLMGEGWGLPFGAVMTNAFTGAVEVRLATFMIQAMVAGAILLALLFYLFWSKDRIVRDGEVCLLFLVFYCASQVVLDSTRYDSLFLPSNGFVSLVQIVSLVGLVVPGVIYSCRMVRCDGLKKFHFALWVPLLASLGLVSYMEYYVQRHGDEALFAYSIMTAGVVAAVVLTMVIRWLGNKVSVDKAPREDVY